MGAAAVAATSPLPSRILRAYFIAEVASGVVLEAARYVPGFDWDADWYRWLYCGALLPVRMLACAIAVLQTRWPSLTVIPFAGVLLWLSVRGIYGPPSATQWILLVDGTIFMAAALGLALTAPFSYHWKIYCTLVFLWVFVAIFDFGYILQPYGKWRELNDSLLPVMVIGAFGWIGLSGWSKKMKLRKEAL